MSEKQLYHHTAEIPGREDISVYNFSQGLPEFLQILEDEHVRVLKRYADFLWSIPVERRRVLLERGIFPPQNAWKIETHKVKPPKKPMNSTGIRKARMEARVIKAAPLFADELIERETEANPDYFAGTAEIDHKRKAMYEEDREAYERALSMAKSE